jgi:hypothetical protein
LVNILIHAFHSIYPIILNSFDQYSKYNKKGALIFESQLFGTITYYITSFQFSNIEIEQYETYRKMSFRNRYVIGGSNGLVHLSVPLEQGRDRQQLMKDTRISYSGRWQAEHLRTLESCYARSPFYEYYRDEVRGLIEKRENFLLDKNMSILAWLAKTLGLSADIRLTETYMHQYPGTITDLRDVVLPKNFQQQPLPFTYTQVFADRIGFQHNLCILDLLFCTGPAAKELLTGAADEK